ncbi:glycoside hydrolase [Cristinia sonorae]|uniref:alpha-1,2-Mannosidase n=1 Tax=Cristinia sonorae TaxID=1940300 RepID=A0A8K0UJ91_9AGAR|nr:glycoside hydrolase [Cristinia sonorae]
MTYASNFQTGLSQRFARLMLYTTSKMPYLGSKRMTFRHVVLLVSATLVITVFYLVGISGRQPPLDDWETLDEGIGWTGNGGKTDDRTGSTEKKYQTSTQEWTRRAVKVKEAYVHAYTGYERHAFPHDELMPLSHGLRDNFNGWGVTAIDTMDTMLLMGLTEQYDRALALVKNSTFPIHRPLHPSMNDRISFFETVIRYLGGMLSAYALSNEPILIQKADELAAILAPVFDTPTGLPWSGFIPETGGVNNAIPWEQLADVASCQLEYAYLARLTGKQEHYARAAKIFDALQKIDLSATGILPTKLNVLDGSVNDPSVSVGAGADSGHEYLLKYYLMTGQTDNRSLDMYMRTVNYVLTNMVFLTPKRGLLYVSDVVGNDHTPAYRLEHLSCFFPGLLALGAHQLPDEAFNNAHKTFSPSQSKLLSSFNLRELHLSAAIGIAETCWRVYEEQPTGLAPEVVKMTSPNQREGAKPTYPASGLWIDAMKTWRLEGRQGPPPGTEEKPIVKDANEKDFYVSVPYSLLRPETVESLYILWRVTGDEVWRDRGWSIFQAIEREARTPSGYSTLRNVAFHGELNDDMPSFFLAETLKYLYLLFLDEDPIPLDKWVFNTEAHPFPVFNWTSWEKHKFEILA